MIDFYIFEHYNVSIKKRGVKMGFQENLRYYREKANLTPTEMAKYLNVAYNTYGYEVRGREPKYDALCKIADLLNVSTDELLGRKNNIFGTNEDERIKQFINDLLAKFDKDGNIKINECLLKDEYKELEDTNSVFFNISKVLYSSIEKRIFVDKFNEIDLFTKNIRDELLYHYLVKYLLTSLQLNLNDDIEGLEEILQSKTIFLNDEPISKEDLIAYKNTIENAKNERKLANNLIEIYRLKELSVLEKILNCIQKIDADIDRKTKEKFEADKKLEQQLIEEIDAKNKQQQENK